MRVAGPPTRAAVPDVTHTYKVEIVNPNGDSYYARGLIDGRVQHIRRLGARRTYRLGASGAGGLQIAGEATNRQREMLGRFSDVQVNELGTGLKPSDYAPFWFRSVGFERHGDLSGFCVTDSRRRQQHNCQ